MVPGGNLHLQFGFREALALLFVVQGVYNLEISHLGYSGNQCNWLLQPVWGCIGGIAVIWHFGVKASTGKGREFL